MDDPTPGPAAAGRPPRDEASEPGATQPGEPQLPRPRRPLVERIGMAAIALVMAGLFGVVALAAVAGGEVFLAAMGALGCLMTIWVGAMTLLRG